MSIIAVACAGTFKDADGKLGYKHSMNDLPLIKHVPVFAICGDKDNFKLHEPAREWDAKMQELGMTHEYLEIAGGGHRGIIYDKDTSRDSVSRIVDFLCRHRRQSPS